MAGRSHSLCLVPFTQLYVCESHLYYCMHLRFVHCHFCTVLHSVSYYSPV